MKSIWPVEERPEELQREEWVNSMNPDTFLTMKRIWDEQQKKEDRGEEIFRKDAPLPTRQLDGGPDNCADLLHEIRYHNILNRTKLNTQYHTPVF